MYSPSWILTKVMRSITAHLWFYLVNLPNIPELWNCTLELGDTQISKPKHWAMLTLSESGFHSLWHNNCGLVQHTRWSQGLNPSKTWASVEWCSASPPFNGYFACADLCAQTEKAIELFEDNFLGTAMATFWLTIPLDTKNEPMMHSQHATCPRSQRSGMGNTAGTKCTMPHFQWLCSGLLFPRVYARMVQRHENHPWGESIPWGGKFIGWISTIQMWKPWMGLLLPPDSFQPTGLQDTALFELVEAHGHIAFF